MIPLILKLKKESHKEIARAQDIIINEMNNVFDYVVLHGGTAIWRCYNGNRFSEDIAVYLVRDVVKLDSFFNNLKKKGFIILKKRIKENSLYSLMQFSRISVRFEAVFKKVESSLKEYETTDSNLITVYTLTPEQLINEKVNAYLKRFKIRDLYDVFFLLRYVTDKSKIEDNLKMLIKKFKNPCDENELKILILEGIVPDLDKILKYIKQRI